MNNFLDFINQDIEAKKTLISCMPTNNKTNKKKYNEKINSIIDNYNEYKDSVEKYIIAKSEGFEVNEPEKDLSNLEKKVNKLSEIVVMLNPLTTFVEKLELDSLLFDITNYANFSFERINEIIHNFVDKFEIAGIHLTEKDFEYTYYVNEYMSTFLKIRNTKNNNYDELSDVFEKIYWFNPEIMEHIELNFRYLIRKNAKTFEQYIVKEQGKLLSELNENNISSYDAAKKRYKELYNDLEKQKEESIAKIVELAKNGEIEINNYFEDNKVRITNYEQLIIEPIENDSDFEKFYESLHKLKNNVLEYKSYNEFIPLYEKFKTDYPITNGENASKQKAIETEISEKEGKLDKINKKIFNKETPKLFNLKKSPESSLKDLKIESLKIAKELYSLYRELDNERLKNLIHPMVNNSMLISDVIKVIYGFNYYRKCIIREVFKLEKYEEVIEKDKDFCLFAKNPNNIIVNGIYAYDENFVAVTIVNKYRFENINIEEEELSDGNLDMLIDKINFVLRVNEIEKSNLNVEKIWFISRVNALTNQKK